MLLAACGGGGAGETGNGAVEVESVGSVTTDSTPAPEGSVDDLLAESPAPDVALVFGTADYAAGENRVAFLVVDGQGELVLAPTARVRVAQGSSLDAVPSAEAVAQNIPVGLEADEIAEGDFDVPSVYVAALDLPDAGPYTLLVEPEGQEIQAVGTIEVAERSEVPAAGDPAVPSDNPTVEDAFAEDITTARPPDTEMLQYSIAQSIDDGVPFVAVFATPKFCASRVCGPVVSIVDTVRRKLEGKGVRFIHVEIFENNDPQQGFNEWVREWSLPTEPWTFVVGPDGLIRDRFEGLVTVDELTASVERELLPAGS